MKMPVIRKKNRQIDVEWSILAEYSLSRLGGDEGTKQDLSVGMDFQILQEAGMPPQCPEEMKRALANFAREAALGQFKQGRSGYPVFISLLCHKNSIDNGCLMEISDPIDAERTNFSLRMIQHADMKLKGGWGYFLIDKGESHIAGASANPHHCVELYLYREGK